MDQKVEPEVETGVKKDTETSTPQPVAAEIPPKSSSFWSKKVPVGIVILFLVLIPLVASIAFYLGNTTLNYTIALPTVAVPGQTPLTYGVQPALSNPNFFAQVRQQFITERATFIEADLTSKIIRVYKNGEIDLEVPIDTEGREGSWWETPAGLYKINKKEDRHFSGIGHVWMPWSMNFQGNFYIHGRTYYPDGTLTSASYTGGCIRLTTENAKKVYDAIEIGTPLLVFEHSFTSDNFKYESKDNPVLNASTFLSADVLSNTVFAQKDPAIEVPIASITKLMTALITTEYINLDNSFKIPSSALVYTSKPRLKTGDEYSVYKLLFPLLRESSNEAAEAIARYYGRSAFIRHMNDKAKAIGMTHTHFADPSGQSAENTSTVEDLFMLSKYIYNNRSFIFNITSGKITQSAYGDTGFPDLGNFNDFITHSYFYGGKNGKTTAAQETSLSVFHVPVHGVKRPIAVIVLGAPNVREEAQKLLDFTLRQVQ